MFMDSLLKTTFSDFNRDLSIRYLEKALPGLSVSRPKYTSIDSRIQGQRDAIPADQIPGRSSQPPVPITFHCRSRGTTSTLTPSLSSTNSTTESEWSDVDSDNTDVSWPDWSRWSRRKSSSSSHTSIDSSTLSVGDCSICTAEASFGSAINREATLTPFNPSVNTETEICRTCAAPDMDSSYVGPKVYQTRDSKAALHPAKTGFALWVGNLGAKTTLIDLRILFGSPHLQSIYLIQRTGCAFVNYNTKDALDAAIELFENRGGRLHEHDLVIKAQVSSPDDNEGQSNETTKPATETPLPPPTTYGPNRYFICKSLLVDDLDLAKRTSKWSTQLRNKDRFNAAFFSSENTYLVFSANRTSAFYGVAKLESPFMESDGTSSECGDCTTYNEKELADVEVTHTAAILHPHDQTPIPAGETVLDPLRGCQFWKVSNCACVEPEVEKWTAPAKIKWLSPSSSIVPFSRTRQLKNSLNMNKPIKVARDGTEIDPEVGAKLCKMFE